MAYRQFQNEKYYDAPEIDFLPRTLQVLHTAQQYRRQEQQRRQNLEDDYKTVIADTTIPSHNRKLNQLAGRVTQMALNDIRSRGQLSNQTRMLQDEIVRKNSESKALAEQFKQLNGEIEKKRLSDPYYKPQYDLDQLQRAIESNDLDYVTDIDETTKKLNSVSQSIGKNTRETFNREKILGDYVSSLGTSENENEYTDDNGVKSKKYVMGTFFLPTGVPGIDNNHVADLFRRDHRLHDSYVNDAMDDIRKDFESYSAQGKQLPSDLQGMNPDEAAVLISQNPAKYPGITLNKTIGDRIGDKARADLKRFEDTRNNVLLDTKDRNPGYRYGVTSNKLNEPAFGYETTVSGPSMTITSKNLSQPYLNLSAASNASVDPTTGEVDYNPLGQNSIVKNIVWTAYTTDKEGNKIPVNLQAKTLKELKDRISVLPNSKMNPLVPSNIVGIAPAFNVSSVDRSNVLDLAYRKRPDLEREVASNPNNTTAQNDLAQLDQIIQQMNLGQDYNEQYLQKILGTNIVRNRLFIANPGDQNVQAFQSQTGLDIYNPKNPLPGISDLQRTFNTRLGEAKNKNFEDTPTNKQLAKPEKKKAPISVTYKGKQYSEEAIKKAAEASGMSVSEYLKELGQ